MAHVAVVGALTPSLHKRLLNRIVPSSSVTTSAPTDRAKPNHAVRPRIAEFLGFALLVTLSCSATLSVAAQTLSPTSVAFGNWVVQTTSRTQTVKLTNTQTVPLTINSISVSGNFAQTSKCPTAPNTLAAGANCNISVTFTPAVLGVSIGTLTVSDNGINSPQTTSLSGTGVSPTALSPASLGFGNQVIDTTSAAKIVTLVNYQTVPLTISGISSSGDFAETSTCPASPNSLGPHSNCTISVTFTPLVTGALSGTLTVTDNASNSPQTAHLSGAGILPVALSVSSMTFPSQLVTVTSASQTVTLRNDQSAALTISAISASGDFSQMSNCPRSPNTLAAGASCTISVTFTPTALGTRTGTLTVSDNVSTSPQTVSLSGIGTLSGLSSISVAPSNPTMPNGNQQPLTAIGSFPNKRTINISNFVAWSSTVPAVAQVSATGVVQALAQGATTITCTYGSISGQTTVTVTLPTLTSITITPSNPSQPVGAYQQLTALLNYSNGSTKETTNAVTWSSANPATASISNSGLAAALATGSTTITATSGSVMGSTTLTVSQPQCVNAPAGLLGWWTGDGDTVDIGGSNSGTLQNGATYSSGEVAQAFAFSGDGASVLVNSPVYSPSAGTLIFWFLPTGSGAMTGSYDGAQDRAPGLSIDTRGNLNWEFANVYAQAVGQVTPNQWNHVALTYATSNSETSVNIYLNGVQVADAVTDANTYWTPQITFGAYLGAQEPSFVGSMDEIAIFNQALSTQQIQQIYNAFSAGMCKPTLQAIAVNPANSFLAPGLSQQFSASGTFSDNSTHDLTSSASWGSSYPAVASVSSSGLVTAVANGNTTISAALHSVEGSTGFTVAPALLSIQVNPQNFSSAAGTTQQFTATGTLTDGSQQNLTASVNWTSSAPAIATVAQGGLANCLIVGQTTITATAGSISGSATLTVTAATLSSIAVSPANTSITAGTAQQFTAIGTFSDGSQQSLTNAVSWTSSVPVVAGIAATGLASGLTSGQTTITAASGAINGSANLNVTSAVLVSITVNPTNPSVVVGGTQPFTATGTFSDGSQQDLTSTATWTSLSASVATIDPSGLATTVTIGLTTITANLNSIVGSTTLTVTVQPPVLTAISVSPANGSLFIGQNQQFYATGTFSDGSQQDVTQSVAWSSTQTTVAGISVTGLVSAASGGMTTITAASGGITGFASLNVSSLALASITVTPASPSIALGTNQQFAATATYADGSTLDLSNSVSWTSALSSVATINATGFASSAATGHSTITATVVGVNGSTTLTVTPATLVSIAVSLSTPSIPLGTTVQFDALGTFTDGTTQNVSGSAQWTTSNSSVATVSNASGTMGLATSVASGQSTISASLGNVSGSAVLTVGSAALTSITITPAIPSIALGTTQQFTATGTFTDGTQQNLTASVTWSSAILAVATVSSTGLGTALSVGTSSITATLGAVSASTVFIVTPATVVSIIVNPSTASIPSGINQLFMAQGTFTDGTTQDVTNSVHWSSSAADVATASSSPPNSGLASTISPGNTTITATLGSVAGTANLIVTSAIPAAIEVNPPSPSVVIGGTEQFLATAIYSDGTSGDVTASASWSSSVVTVATMGSSTPGLAGSTGTGETRISANFGGLSGSTTLIVQDQLVSIALLPSGVSLATGSTQQFTASGTYSSGVVENLTDSVAWSTSAPEVASISGSGLAMALASGQANVEASMGNIMASANLLSVTPDTLGTASATTVACPHSSIGGTCYAVTISCPNINDLNGYVKVTSPIGASLGTVLFSSSGNGIGLYESFTYGSTTLDTLLAAGFTLAQISWGGPFAKQPFGWQTGPGGIRAAACRYATLAEWIYTNIHLANTTAPFCATGNSSGAQLIGLALAHYGMGSLFTMVEPTSGPPFARQDWACDCLQPQIANPCGVPQGFCVGLGNAQKYIDPAYPAPLCSDEVQTRTTTYDSTFLHDSILAPDAVFAYPNTFVNFVYGTQDPSTASNQGHAWASAITSSKAESCIADAQHNIPDVLDGAQQIANDIVTYCKLPSGP